MYWDPDRILFTIPLLEIPVMIYGALFSLGFICSYFVLIHVLKVSFERQKEVKASHIADWSQVFMLLKKSGPSGAGIIGQVWKLLPASSQHEIAHYSPTLHLDEATQASILEAFCHFPRAAIDKAFAKGVHSAEDMARRLMDSLVWYAVIGTIIGARLGDVLFYDWDYYKLHPLQIFNIRQGGLASHGGTVGILLALSLFVRQKRAFLPNQTFIQFLDLFSIVAPLAGCFIRVGNFFNQEILGTATSVPWAVTFGHPVDGHAIVPRHPVQLYEGAAYLFIFFTLFFLWKRRPHLTSGTLSGLCLILIFSARFILEFFKVDQFGAMSQLLQTGQWLSLPFILAGALLIRSGKKVSSSLDQKLKTTV